jgi:putative ABC transport system substrate-binding protein
MRRREFIAIAAGAAATWPLAARAQTATKRVGIMMLLPETEPEAQARATAFRQTLASLSWVEGHNIHLDYRWGVGDLQAQAAELVALAPDAILANAPPSIIALRKTDRVIPVVFVSTTDPIVLGLVKSLAHPGGNATGFVSGEVGLSGKWLELLKEIAPNVKRAAVLLAPKDTNVGAEAQLAAVRPAAISLDVELSRIDIGSPADMERSVSEFASTAHGGLIVTRTAESSAAHKTIIALAARYRLPAVYPERFYVTDGGLAAYGADVTEEFRQAAAYIDRILRGEKPGDLPVQAPTKYELVVNLKTAKALGLAIPESFLSRADEVIE